jgi:hypothetical protein
VIVRHVNGYGCLRSAGVAYHVGQRFLHDSVRRQGHSRWYGRKVAVGRQRDRHVCSADLFDEFGDVVQPGSGPVIGRTAVSQDINQTFEFTRGRVTGGADRIEGTHRFVRLAVDEVDADTGLYRDDTQRVGDNIVEFLGDPQPLISCLQVGDFHCLSRSRDGCFDLAFLTKPTSSEHPTESKAGGKQNDADLRPASQRRRTEGKEDGVEDRDHRHAAPRQAERQVRRNAVQRDHQCEEGDAVSLLSQFERHNEDQANGQGPQRPASSPDKGATHANREHPAPHRVRLDSVGIGRLYIDPGHEHDDSESDHRQRDGVVPHMRTHVAAQNVQESHQAR